MTSQNLKIEDVELPIDWVERIHTRLLVRYTNLWVAKHAGLNAEAMDAVKKDWASVLGRVSASQIKFGLENLPEQFPPTSTQFAAICLRRPEYINEKPSLEAPPANPDRMAEIIKEVKSALSRKSGIEWAKRLKERAENGERQPLANRDMWNQALADPPLENLNGVFVQIPDDALPSAMRKGAQ